MIECSNLHVLTCIDLGQWSSPSMKGARPPPCEGFSLTMIDEDKAVMFGGPTSSGISSDARILHLPTMVSISVSLSGITHSW